MEEAFCWHGLFPSYAHGRNMWLGNKKVNNWLKIMIQSLMNIVCFKNMKYSTWLIWTTFSILSLFLKFESFWLLFAANAWKIPNFCVSPRKESYTNFDRREGEYISVNYFFKGRYRPSNMCIMCTFKNICNDYSYYAALWLYKHILSLIRRRKYAISNWYV